MGIAIDPRFFLKKDKNETILLHNDSIFDIMNLLKGQDKTTKKRSTIPTFLIESQETVELDKKGYGKLLWSEIIPEEKIPLSKKRSNEDGTATIIRSCLGLLIFKKGGKNEIISNQW